MFYVFDELTTDANKAVDRFPSLEFAKASALQLKARTGRDHYIIEIAMVWTTKFLENAILENANADKK